MLKLFVFLGQSTAWSLREKRKTHWKSWG